MPSVGEAEDGVECQGPGVIDHHREMLPKVSPLNRHLPNYMVFLFEFEFYLSLAGSLDTQDG